MLLFHKKLTLFINGLYVNIKYLITFYGYIIYKAA